MRLKKLLIFFLVLFLYAEISWGDTNEENDQALYRLTVGVSAIEASFEVVDEGELSEDYYFSPYITLGSPYKYFEDSNWGRYLEFSFSTFNLNQQLVEDEFVDLDTSVKGYSVFVTPTIFYTFFGKGESINRSHALIAGVGIGAGYLNAKGDIVFTEFTQERHDFNVSGVGLSVSVFTEYRIGSFITRALINSVTYKKGDLEYDAATFSWNFGYTFEF